MTNDELNSSTLSGATSAGDGALPDDIDFGQTIRGFVEGQEAFGRYRLRKILGRGGMGLVWLAWDGRLERDVALKFMPEMVRLDASAIDDLKRETRKSLELTHANIVRIHDFAMDDLSAAIAMEYVDGPTLSALRIQKPNRVFEPDEIVEWVRQLCAALDYAHSEAKIVHRDLKPANLMLSSGGRLKITDFGIARSISDSMSRVSVQHHDSSGTLAYMSPQQAIGAKPSSADDIYSLGATLYDLLTGKPPFHSGNIYAQVREVVPPPIAERRVQLDVGSSMVLPESWEKMIAACLAKDPAHRPQSAAEIWEGLNVRVSADTLKKSSRFPVRVAAVVVLSLIAAGAGWWFGYEQPRQQAAAALAAQAQAEGLARQAAAAEAQVQKEEAETAARQEAERKKAEAAAAEQARIAAAKQQLITETQDLAQKALAAKQWNQAESIADKLTSLDPQNTQIASIRQSTVVGREAQRTSEERARALPPDLPASAAFSTEAIFAPSPYASYNNYSQSQILRRAQEKLKSAGLYSGSADGESGAGTTNALIAFQRADMNLPVSGRLDDPTLAALGLTGIAEMTAPTPTPRPKPTATPRPKPAGTTKPPPSNPNSSVDPRSALQRNYEAGYIDKETRDFYLEGLKNR